MGFASADEPRPLIPHSFYGEITIQGVEAPEGTILIALIEEEVRGELITTEEGFYGRFPKLVIEGFSADSGKTIEFCINEVKANETSKWKTGEVERRDLTSSEEECPVVVTLPSVSIKSTNENESFAKTGDSVILTFTASKEIKIPEVTINGNIASAVNTSGNNWQATREMQATDPEGNVEFTIDFEDLQGNQGQRVTKTKDGSSVIFDRRAPSEYSVLIDQSKITKENETALSFTFSGAEIGTEYNYSINSTGGGTQVSGTGNISKQNQQIENINVSGLGDGTLTLTVTLTDQAGNTGKPATDTVEKISDPATTPTPATGGPGGGTGTAPTPTPTERTETVLFEETVEVEGLREDLNSFLELVGKERRMASAMDLNEKVFIERKLVVKEIEEHGEKSYLSEITITVRNESGRIIENLFLIEEIQKEISESASEIKSAQGFAVLIEDPVIEFYLGNLLNNAEKSVSYTVPREVSVEEFKAMVQPVYYEIKESVECDDENPCTIGEYNAETGECEFTEKPDGIECGEGMQCRKGECIQVTEPTPVKTPVESPVTTPTPGEEEIEEEDNLLLLIGIIIAIIAVLGAAIFILMRKNIIMGKKKGL